MPEVDDRPCFGEVFNKLFDFRNVFFVFKVWGEGRGDAVSWDGDSWVNALLGCVHVGYPSSSSSKVLEFLSRTEKVSVM